MESYTEVHGQDERDAQYDRDREREIDGEVHTQEEKDKAMAEIEQGAFNEVMISFLKKSDVSLKNEGYIPTIELLVDILEGRLIIK